MAEERGGRRPRRSAALSGPLMPIAIDSGRTSTSTGAARALLGGERASSQLTRPSGGARRGRPRSRRGNRATQRERGPRVDLLGRADLLDRAVAHHRDGLGDAQRLRLVVGDEQRGHPGAGEDLADLLAQAVAQAGVEVRERLVEQDQLRGRRQRPRQRDPLLLAAGELVHGPRRRRRRGRPARGPRRRARGRACGRGRSRRCRRRRGGGRGRSPGRPCRSAGSRGRRTRPAPQHVRSPIAISPGVGPLEPGDQPQGRRLAAARRPEQGADRARPRPRGRPRRPRATSP